MNRFFGVYSELFKPFHLLNYTLPIVFIFYKFSVSILIPIKKKINGILKINQHSASYYIKWKVSLNLIYIHSFMEFKCVELFHQLHDFFWSQKWLLGNREVRHGRYTCL